MARVAEIGPLKPEDTMLIYGALGNFSLSGFELVLTRYVSTYIITYYLPSGTRNAYLSCLFVKNGFIQDIIFFILRYKCTPEITNNCGDAV
jgi:hypothetical protein